MPRGGDPHQELQPPLQVGLAPQALASQPPAVQLELELDDWSNVFKPIAL